ncbi:MAG: hypothetical protein SGJ18_03345 [Pseudomonadota bacterium]|nr:hypothetical protein [Pseudomonadota bacterium]
MSRKFLKAKLSVTFFVLLLCCLSGSGAQAFRGEKVQLKTQLQTSLNHLLEGTTSIHEAFFNQDESQIESNTRKVLADVQSAQQKTKYERSNGLHVERILQVVSNHLAQLLGSTGEDRKKYLRLAFDQVVHIAQTYKLDSYRIFYCHSSNGIWLQKSWKAQNPYNPQTLANCGIPVR